MNREELQERISRSAVIRQRLGSPGAFVRGWRIESANVLGDPDAAQAAGRLLRNLIADIAAGSIVGIERSGTVLSRSIAAEAARDGIELLDTTWNTARSAPAPTYDCFTSRAIVVDDIVNSGRTMRRAIRGLESLGVDVLAAACLIQYPNGRLGLHSWERPLLSAFGLHDLQLRRFIWPMLRN